jgi:hypothetical protein
VTNCAMFGYIGMSQRRFPPPWSVEALEECFIVRDANGQALASSISRGSRDGARPSSSPATRRGALLPMLLSWRTSCEAPPDADPCWGKSHF